MSLINFFEEFSDSGSLLNAKFIKNKSIVFLAAKSLKQFLSLAKEIRSINKNVVPGYWPIIEDTYWISPLAPETELNRLGWEFLNEKLKRIPVLLDLELPILRPKMDLIKQVLFSFAALKNNATIISGLYSQLQRNKSPIYTAEYPIPFLDLSFNYKKIPCQRIYMCYTSMCPNILKNAFRYFVKKQRCPVGLGVIAKGIFGDEKIITEKDLLYDLKYFKNTREIFIFRLGGLTKELAAKIGA